MQIIEHFEIHLKLESKVLSTIFRASLSTSVILTQAVSLLPGKLILHLSR